MPINKPGKRLFILDTNVLMHDPMSLFHFGKHDVYLPMVVLEEMDAGKKGLSEVARNVRQVSRFLDELMHNRDKVDIEKGIPLQIQSLKNNESNQGRLFFQFRSHAVDMPDSLPGNKPDNNILGSALSLQERYPDTRITLVSKDINLRIKATILGVHTEDYFDDRVLDDANLLFSGSEKLPDDFWGQQGDDIESWQQAEKSYYKVHGPQVNSWHSNQHVYLGGDNGFEARVSQIEEQPENKTATLEILTDYASSTHSVWGINARNREQNFALNMLMNPDIDIVTILGTAGTGKTLLALAAGMVQTLEDNRYKEIIMTRATVSVGEDIGFLPGTEEEKMAPWMGALMDNLEVLNPSETSGGEWGRAATNELLANRIKIRSINFMRGRTFLNRYLILDEAQNLTPKQMKTLITRAGPGTKIVCLGNVAQIDTPYITESSSGLTYVVDRFKNWEHSGHIILQRGERSRLADYAADIL
ncbi:MAG: PhoH family protein [Gammaproteobacteria bacterium]